MHIRIYAGIGYANVKEWYFFLRYKHLQIESMYFMKFENHWTNVHVTLTVCSFFFSLIACVALSFSLFLILIYSSCSILKRLKSMFNNCNALYGHFVVTVLFISKTQSVHFYFRFKVLECFNFWLVTFSRCSLLFFPQFFFFEFTLNEFKIFLLFLKFVLVFSFFLTFSFFFTSFELKSGADLTYLI